WRSASSATVRDCMPRHAPELSRSSLAFPTLTSFQPRRRLLSIPPSSLPKKPRNRSFCIWNGKASLALTKELPDLRAEVRNPTRYGYRGQNRDRFRGRHPDWYDRGGGRCTFTAPSDFCIESATDAGRRVGRLI